LSLSNEQIPKDGGIQNIPVIKILNEDYDEDQDQSPEERLPICEELRFMHYTDGADQDEESKCEIHGFVFLYVGMGK
jgi:hypothetical protein